MIITFTILAILFYLRLKVKALWSKGHCKYIIGTFVIFIVSIYLYTLNYPLRSPLPYRKFSFSSATKHIFSTDTTNAVSRIFSSSTAKIPISKPTFTCLIPVLSPNDTLIHHNISELKEVRPILCTSEELPLTFDTDKDSNLARINTTSEKDFKWTKCSYRSAVSTDDFRFLSFSNEVFAIENETIKIPTEHEFIGIQCQEYDNPHLIEVLALVQEKPEVETRFDNFRKDHKLRDDERLNVQLIMLDSVSHISFIRSFNRTYEFLMKNLSTVELNGLSITKDTRAFESIVNLLTGQNLPTKRMINPHQILMNPVSEEPWDTTEEFDSEYPYIWQKFSSQAFYTALVEDCPVYFNSKTNEESFEFLKQPTDYYPSPSFALFDTVIEPKLRAAPKAQCYGARNRFQVLMDYWKRLANFGRNNRTYFMALAACELTEDKISLGKIDQFLLDQLVWLKEGNHLNRSAVFIIGNQGVKPKSEELFKTYHEALEFRMPAGFIILPTWFSTKYPKAANNLLRNRRALVTHSDIHETIMDLSDLNNLSDQQISNRTETLLLKSLNNETYSQAISLFLPIPYDRDCKKAGIDEKVCTCQYDPVHLSPDDEAVRSSVATVLEHLNQKLKNYSKCAELSISEVHSAIIQSAEAEYNKVKVLEQLNSKNYSGITIHLSLSTKPGNATFDAVLRRQESNTWTLLKDITLSQHSNHPRDCISPEESLNSIIIANLCYCK